MVSACVPNHNLIKTRCRLIVAQIKSFCLIFDILDDLAEIIWPFLTNFSPFYQPFTTFLPHVGLNPWFTICLTEHVRDYSFSFLFVPLFYC